MKHKTLIIFGNFFYSFSMLVAALYLHFNTHYIPMGVFILFSIMTGTFKIESDGAPPFDYSFVHAKLAYVIWLFVKLLFVFFVVVTVMLHWYPISGILFYLLLRYEESVTLYDE